MSSRRAKSILLLACVWVVVPTARGQTPRHLFLDPATMEDAKGVVLRVNPPQAKEIVIRTDRPWEQRMISLFLTVLDEKPKLRMWYICRDGDNRPNVAYAESEDGVTWCKPNLGIVDYHGSKDNNLVGISSLEGMVFRDPKGKSAEQYIYVTHVSKQGIFRYYSPDGLHWQRDPQPLLPFAADTQNVTLFDPQLGSYVLYLRGWDWGKDSQGRWRKVVRLRLDTLSSPAPIKPSGRPDDRPSSPPHIVDEIPTVLRADEGDPKNCDVYNISALLYPPDPRWYVGFPSFLLREKGVSDGRVEVQFVGSRDGIAWHRYDRAPYVTPGLQGSESANVVYMGTGMAVRGEEIWQYGMGLRSRHGSPMQTRQGDGSIRRYVQRLDGFVSADFDSAGGRFTTAPVQVTGKQLSLNLDTRRAGRIAGGGARFPGRGDSRLDGRRLPTAPYQCDQRRGPMEGLRAARVARRPQGSPRLLWIAR